AEAFGLDDEPSAVTDVVPEVLGPVFPTDGCYTWEDAGSYNRRRRSEFLNLGTTEVPRACLDKAILVLKGANFGVNPLGTAGVLRVTLYNPTTGDTFEASTTSAQGNHKQLCAPPACEHTQTSVKVWVPFGSGRGLRVRVQIGNSVVESNLTVSYEPPKIE